jgi:hypothetical protein
MLSAHANSIQDAVQPPSNDNPPRLSLLGLPAELRNSIYTLSVTEPNKALAVVVSPSHYRQPPLLRTCQKIRSEALGIFEAENRFMLHVNDLRPVNPGSAHWISRIPNGFFFNDNCKLIRRNLWAWIKMYAHDEAKPLVATDECPRPVKAMAQAFEIVKKMKRLGMTWENTEDFLESWKRTVDATDPGFWFEK